MRLFQANNSVLILEPWRERETITWDFESTREMLSSVILHATKIGASRIVLGFSPEANEMTLRFWCPAPGHPTSQWWDMVPPPNECYPYVVQVCLQLAKLEESFPLKGVINCRLNRRFLTLDFSMNSLTEIHLTWNAN